MESPDDLRSLMRKAADAYFAGRHEQTLALLNRALALRPNQPDLHFRRGVMLLKLGRDKPAAASFNRAATLRPGWAEPLFQLALVQLEHRSAAQALDNLDKAIAANPDTARFHRHRAAALVRLRRLTEAIEACNAAIALEPLHFWPYNVRAEALIKLGRANEAIESLEAAACLAPDKFEVVSNMGTALQAAGRPTEGLAWYEKALALDPTFPPTRINHATCLLMLGDFENGWRAFEQRRDPRSHYIQHGFPKPVWLGDEDIAGQTLLVHAEQGLGDTLMFCRFAPLLEQRGINVLLAPQPALRKLMQSLSPTVEIVAEDDETLVFDRHCRIMSLPLALGTRLETIPQDMPYLSVAPERLGYWRARLGESGFKIGVCWRASPKGDLDGRSFPAGELARLLALDGVRLISLQKITNPDDALAAAAAGIEQPCEFNDDDGMNEAAAIACVCDLVISSDTAIAHLAGALNRPVWMVKPPHGDWRWLLNRDDTPWYPSMRLYRQVAGQGWSEAFDRVEAELRLRMAAA